MNDHLSGTLRLILLTTALTIGLAGQVLGQDDAGVDEAQRAVLIELYHATDGDSWSDNRFWLDSPGTECTWYGVRCGLDTEGELHVERLLLNGNGLKGEFPASLAALERLEVLDLADNSLHGTIPGSILQLAENVEHALVDLSGNLFDAFSTDDAPVSSESISYFRVDLSDNRIEALPPESWGEADVITALNLSDNHLHGSLDFGDLAWTRLNALALSDNEITEIVGLDAPGLEILLMDNNKLTALPEFLPDMDNLKMLMLNGNHLHGELPEWFSDLNLFQLGLDDNTLSGPVERALSAIDLDDPATAWGYGGLYFHAANNHFDGALPTLDYARFNSPEQGHWYEYGLDLCFNDIELPAPEVLEQVNDVHRGQDLESCLGRPRIALKAQSSGSWFSPQRSGEGLSQVMIDDDQVLVYWFTFLPTWQVDGAPMQSRQMWMFNVASPREHGVTHRPLWTTRGGRFAHGLENGELDNWPLTWIRQDQLSEDSMHFYYDLYEGGTCNHASCTFDVQSGRHDLSRLTQLAGTTCDTQSDYQQYSGAWYNPERVGEGFIVEVLPDDRVVVYWFTHTPDESGAQAWMMADGNISSFEQITLPTLQPKAVIEDAATYRPLGGHFGHDFDPADVTMSDWGRLHVSFYSEDTGRVFWESDDPDFGSGDYPIERLARPKLAECE